MFKNGRTGYGDGEAKKQEDMGGRQAPSGKRFGTDGEASTYVAM